MILECDEIWSYVGKKRCQKWIWLAINRETREIVGVAIGARTKATARKLWASLPAVYRQCAVYYSDVWEAYAAILPSKRHHACGKESGQTNHIERRAIRYANAVVGWCTERSHSRKSWQITLVQSGTSSMIIMHGNARNAASLLLHDYRLQQLGPPAQSDRNRRSTARLALQPALLLREACRLDAIVCAQLLNRCGEVIAHRSFGER